MIVPQGAKDPEGAWAFIKYWSGLTDPDTAAEFYTWGGWLPLTPAIANATKYRTYLKKYPQFQTFVDLMPSKSMQVLPSCSVPGVSSPIQLGKMEDSAMRGTLSPLRRPSTACRTLSITGDQASQGAWL